MNRRTILATLSLVGALFTGTLTTPWGLSAGRPAAQDAGEPLPTGALARLGSTRFRPGGAITGLAVSRDGSRIASATYDQWLRIWDATDGRELRAFAWEGVDLADMRRLEFSPDGKTLAFSGNMDSLLHLWDATTGKERLSLGQVEAKGVGPAFHLNPDGKTILWLDGEGFHLSDVKTGKEVWNRVGVITDVVAFAPDGKTLAVFGDLAVLINAANGETLRIFPLQPNACTCVALSPDGRTLAAGVGEEVHLWDVVTGKERRQPLPAPPRLRYLAFSADGKTLVMGTNEGAIEVWDLAAGKMDHGFPLTEEIEGKQYPATHIVFSSDGKTAVWAASGRIHQTDIASGKERFPFSEDDPYPTCPPAFSPDGKLLVVPGTDGKLRLWDAAAGKVLRRFEGPAGQARFLGFLPDGKSLICIADGVTLWDTTTGKEVRRYEQVSAAYDSVMALSPDGKLLAFGAVDDSKVYPPSPCRVRWWDLQTGKLRAESSGAHRGSIHSIAFSPDSTRLASIGSDGDLCLWDASSGKELWRAEKRRDQPFDVAHRVVFGADGRTVVTAALDFDKPRDAVRVEVWDAASGARLRQFKMSTFDFQAVFSPDGKLIAFWGLNSALQIWDVNAGRSMGEWNPKGGKFIFSPDGKYLAAWGWNGSFLIWDVAAALQANRP